MRELLPKRRHEMPKVLRLDKGAEEGLQELLKFLLESGKVKGVITLTKWMKAGGGLICLLPAYMCPEILFRFFP